MEGRSCGHKGTGFNRRVLKKGRLYYTLRYSNFQKENGGLKLFQNRRLDFG
jgi:hypothetical protein